MSTRSCSSRSAAARAAGATSRTWSTCRRSTWSTCPPRSGSGCVASTRRAAGADAVAAASAAATPGSTRRPRAPPASRSARAPSRSASISSTASASPAREDLRRVLSLLRRDPLRSDLAARREAHRGAPGADLPGPRPRDAPERGRSRRRDRLVRHLCHEEGVAVGVRRAGAEDHAVRHPAQPRGRGGRGDPRRRPRRRARHRRRGRVPPALLPQGPVPRPSAPAGARAPRGATPRRRPSARSPPATARSWARTSTRSPPA